MTRQQWNDRSSGPLAPTVLHVSCESFGLIVQDFSLRGQRVGRLPHAFGNLSALLGSGCDAGDTLG